MALNKRQYVDGQTIVTASNLNEIQDCIITLENNYVPKTRTVAGKALSSNITLSAGDVGAVPTSRTINSKALTGNITLSAADVGAVPVSRTVNGKALSSNITLSAADVSAVPTTRKVNSKALSQDISLTASDVGAVPTGRTVNGKALSSDITLAASDVGAVPTNRTVNGKALSSNITLASSDIGDDSGAGGANVKESLAALNDSLDSIHKVYYSVTELGLATSPKPTLSAVALAMESGSQAVLTNTEIDETELTQNLNLATVILIYKVSAVRIFAFGARSYANVNIATSRLFYASFNSNQSLWYGWKEIAWKDIATYEATNIFTGLNTPDIKSQNNIVSIMVNALSGGATLSLSQSWNTLFQLPTGIRPSTNFRFPIADYSDGVTFYQGQITTGGVVRIYMPTAKAINPEFVVTYLI